jgi:hypothetical protein
MCHKCEFFPLCFPAKIMCTLPHHACYMSPLSCTPRFCESTNYEVSPQLPLARNSDHQTTETVALTIWFRLIRVVRLSKLMQLTVK